MKYAVKVFIESITYCICIISFACITGCVPGIGGAIVSVLDVIKDLATYVDSQHLTRSCTDQDVEELSQACESSSFASEEEYYRARSILRSIRDAAIDGRSPSCSEILELRDMIGSNGTIDELLMICKE